MQFPGRRRGRRSVQKNILPRGKATNNVSCSPPITSSLCPTSRATMATINPEDCFQKKSFLIRDILSQTSKAYDNSSRTENGKGNMIDWMFLNPPHQPGGLQDLFRHNSARGLNKSVIHKGADASMNNVNEDEDGQLILTDQLQARLYQNLCYYALQQQIICGGRPVLTSSSSSSIASSLPTDQNDQQFNFEKNSENQSNEETRALPILSSTTATTVCRKNLTNQNLSKKRTSKAMKPINKMTVKLANKAQSFVRRQAPPSSIGPKPIKMIGKNSNITNHEQEKHSNHNNSQNSLEMIMNMSNDLLEENDNHCNAGKNQKKFHKIRRNRTVFTELQLMGLERRFDSQKYLSTPDRTDLARALGLTQLQVKTWYQNRRMKWKKQVMQNGCPFPPTKPKGRPKKDSIPTYGLEFTNSILCPLMASVRSTNNHQDDDVDAHAEDD